MKKASFVIIFALIIAFITTKAFQAHIKSEKKNYAYNYLVTNLNRLAKSINSSNIVFLGSSSIQGMNTAMITNKSMNLGIGGETLPFLSKRVASYTQLSKAKALVLMVGFNDICKESEEVYIQFKSLMNVIPKKKPMVLVGLQPATSQHLCSNLQEKIKHYNQKLAFYCNNKNTQCEYTQLFNEQSTLYKAQYDSKNSKNIQNYFEIDQIHLNEKGYEILQNNISNSLDKLLSDEVNEK